MVWEKEPKDQFRAVLNELAELHSKKAVDYGSDGDPLANIRTAADFGVEPWVYAVIRINDNLHRLKRFVQRGGDESAPLGSPVAVESLRDIAVFAPIAIILYREKCNEAVGEPPKTS